VPQLVLPKIFGIWVKLLTGGAILRIKAYDVGSWSGSYWMILHQTLRWYASSTKLPQATVAVKWNPWSCQCDVSGLWGSFDLNL